ncbi:esterase-like activity of phytase family protein [Ottowia sp.]|jgi:hypothetical protein|uniref:esterase-like activity of phytase family protein n=1 Tax=Ottowia sp. TaxID=1898956 RepID=UPI0025ECD7B2|nr:esterase-like activity of phytase family protein [Ottowia sp.]MBK6615326.1 esterase-like activity of phytase family protein [Ottowia sp.]
MTGPDRTPPLSRRAALRALAGAAALLGGGARALQPPAAGTPALKLIAHGSLASGQSFQNTTIGGLSGLAGDARTGLWYALSDDRSRHAPARCYVLRLPPFAAGQPLLPQWVDVITLLGPDGQPFPRHRVDPEALALRQDEATGATTLLWTSEGDLRARIPPALYESALDGRLLRELPLPPLLRQTGARGRGPRNNETLEALATTPDGRHAWAGMESALAQDAGGPGAPAGPCRITRFDLARGRADRQVAYLPEPLPFGMALPHGPAESGVAEVLVADEHRLWVLERAWTPATGVSARLYEADLRGASDTLGIDTLRPGRYRPTPKRLLLDLRASGLPHVDNFEAMAWGPPLPGGWTSPPSSAASHAALPPEGAPTALGRPGGGRTLVMMTDDNFNPLQVTQFAAFEVVE